MKVINTTDKEIKVSFKGNHYVLPANGECNVSKEDAKSWKEIQPFLTFEDGEAEEIKEEVKEEIKEDVEEEKEDNGGEIDLGSLSRKELDNIAEEMGLNPEDYANKGEVIEAIKG